jgi:hypothetical protein
MKGEGEETAPKAGSPPPERLPYEKPSVIWEQPLEAKPSLMAACAKLPAQAGVCTTFGPESS